MFVRPTLLSRLSGAALLSCFFVTDRAPAEIYTFPYTTLFRSELLGLPFDEAHGGTGTGALMVLVAIEEHHQRPRARSEEHTSELQSHSDLVCRLLLEKKKQTTSTTSTCRLRTALTHRPNPNPA